MAAGNFHWVTKAIERALLGEIDLEGDTFKAVLLTEVHTPNQDGDDILTDLTGASPAEEVTDADYAVQTLSGLAVSISGGEVRFDFADIDFGNAVTIEAKYLYIYDDTHASDCLIGFLDLNTASTSATVSSTADDFDIALAGAGALKLTRTAYSAGN